MFICTPAEFLAAEPLERRKLVVAQIEATPDLHDQDVWAEKRPCGTVCCAAGWTVTLAGDRLRFGVGEAYVEVIDDASVALLPIEYRAATLLDLDEAETEATFFAADDADDVRVALLGRETAT